MNGENVNGEDMNEVPNSSLIIRKVFLFVYIVFMLFLVSLPLNNAGSGFLTNTYIVKIRLDYLVHIVLFQPFLFLMKQAYSGPFLIMLMAGLVFAGFCEGVQYLLPYRSFNINDLIANEAGIMLGIVIVVSWNFLRQKIKGERQK